MQKQLKLTLRISYGSPGSGKTTAILQRLEQLARTGVPASRVLVLSPNRIAAGSMRDQILLSTGWASDSDLARTVQSVAYEVLQTRSSLETADAGNKIKLLTGAEQTSILEQILESEFGQGIRALWSLPTETLKLPSFLNELRDLIAVCQQHDVRPETIIEIASVSKKPVLLAAGRILGEYRRHLEKISGYDAQSLVRIATESLKVNPSHFRNLGWVFLDDAQDFTSTELALIAQLAKVAELEIFADPDSTVLGFRAAAPEDLVQILGESRDIERLNIEASQSRQLNLAEAMQRVAQRLPTALAGTQRASLVVRKNSSEEEAPSPELLATADASSEDSMQLRIFDSVSAEADFLADAIRRRRLESGLQWSDIAVVGRTRAQLDQLTNSLSQHGIPVRVQAAQTPLAKFGIAGDLLDFVADVNLLPKTGVQGLQQLLNSRLSKIDSLDIRALKRRLCIEPEGYQAAVAALVLESEFGEVKGPFATKARKFGQLIALAQGAENMTPHELISKIWKSSGLEKSLVADSVALSEVGFAAQRDLDSMVELVSAAIRFSDSHPESNALQFTQFQRELNVVEDSLVSQSSIGSVQILTPAGLLARRFKLIFAPRLQEGIWPNLRPRNSLLYASSLDAFFRGTSADPVAPMRSELAQELRMFYKMLGASDSAVVLSAVQLNDESPSQFLNLVTRELPAPVGYRREYDIRARVAQFRRQLNSGSAVAANSLAVLARVGAPGAHPTSWYSNIEYEDAAAITQPDSGPTVSPSQLEKFLQCPLHWFISSYGGEGRGFEASIGTLLHEALEVGEPSFEGLWQVVESKWGQLNLSDSWQGLADRRKAISMVRAMAQYLKEIEGQAVTTVEREQKLSAVVSGVKVRGTLDRLERLVDGTLRVVDLKTGQVGTKLEVAQNLQLGLYQILVEHNYPDSRVAGARILSVKDGVAKKLEQPPLDSVFREKISDLLERAKREFPGPSFEAHPDQHCNEPGSVCSILLAPELRS